MSAYYVGSAAEREPAPLYSGDSGSSYPVRQLNPAYLHNASSSPYSEFAAGVIHAGVKDARSELFFMQMMDHGCARADDGGGIIQSDPHAVMPANFGVLDGHVSALPPVPSQGLSLGLTVPAVPYWPAVKPDLYGGEELDGRQTMIGGSKYLKATQGLLDEVVSIWKPDGQRATHKAACDSAAVPANGGDARVLSNPPESTANAAVELSASEKQELQHKLAKLLTMLDEVDRRYKHYYYQMQLVVSSFDAVAGDGSAKPYTAVARRTISRHFRCLKDAITDQVQAIRRRLGEEDAACGKESRLVRLRYIDQQLRQQRTFQQYGLMHQNAWRPQRGLPENSVSILRAWLFEHFLHPYPKESEKLVLAKQTGLTRSQISNWFINARVRLWKPMIEDMYNKEVADADPDSNSSSDNAPSRTKNLAAGDDKEEIKIRSGHDEHGKLNVGEATHMPYPGADDSFINLMLKAQHRSDAAASSTGGLLQSTIAHTATGHVLYPMADLGWRGAGSVSLTLGLQHSGGSQAARNAGDVYSTVGIPSAEYDNQRQQFEASPLLHDFVA